MSKEWGHGYYTGLKEGSKSKNPVIAAISVLGIAGTILSPIIKDKVAKNIKTNKSRK